MFIICVPFSCLAFFGFSFLPFADLCPFSASCLGVPYITYRVVEHFILQRVEQVDFRKPAIVEAIHIFQTRLPLFAEQKTQIQFLESSLITILPKYELKLIVNSLKTSYTYDQPLFLSKGSSGGAINETCQIAFMQTTLSVSNKKAHYKMKKCKSERLPVAFL